MATYELSVAAEEDLANIYYTGVVDFGLQQADAYYAGLVTRLNRIGATPLIYPDVSYIRDQYRRSVYGAHSIYYRIDEGQVFIVRIIRQQQL